MKTQLIDYYDTPPEPEDSEEQVLAGLLAAEKTIAPKFFYDEVGSDLFTRITRQPEYYLTRTELKVLRENAVNISDRIGPDSLLIEYGSGSSEKIRVLLESIRPKVYAPLDISGDYLTESAATLAAEYPWLEVRATCVDYSSDFELPFEIDARPVAFFPGSSVGNFSKAAALQFLERVQCLVGEGGGLLIGVDLAKDTEILNAAYNDANGVTEKFNLNVLNHLNHAFSGNFDTDQFAHVASYNEREGCVQMFLESQSIQCVKIAGREIEISEGERIHTENSHKYSLDEFLAMARKAGFQHHECWTDDQDWFAVIFLS